MSSPPVRPLAPNERLLGWVALYNNGKTIGGHHGNKIYKTYGIALGAQKGYIPYGTGLKVGTPEYKAEQTKRALSACTIVPVIVEIPA